VLVLAASLTGCGPECSTGTARTGGRNVLSEARGGHGEYPAFQGAIWEVFRTPPEVRAETGSPARSAPNLALLAIAVGLGNSLTQASDRETLLSVVEWVLYNTHAGAQRAELLAYLAQTDLGVLPPPYGRRLAQLIADLPPMAWVGVDPELRSRLLNSGEGEGLRAPGGTPPSPPP